MSSGKKVKAIQEPSFDEELTLKSIGQFIKARRTQEGLTTVEASMLCGVTTKTLNDIENGKDGKMSTILEIMNALGIKLQIARWSKDER